jgi:hypothetical protein
MRKVNKSDDETKIIKKEDLKLNIALTSHSTPLLAQSSFQHKARSL